MSSSPRASSQSASTSQGGTSQSAGHGAGTSRGGTSRSAGHGAGTSRGGTSRSAGDGASTAQRRVRGRRAGARPRGHVVITGAAGAIGAALARAMRAAWPEVELALVDREPTAIAAEVRGASYVADLADLDRLPALVARIEANGPIDGLVNCAGIMRVRDVAEWKWEDARELVTIDLLAPLRLQDLVVRGMIDRGGGLLVNIASMAGRVPLKGCAYYGAAKAGLAMASEIARADLAGRGVQVVTVYPGPVKSALEAGARADYGGAGLFGRFAPTGDPGVLAAKIMRAIADDSARVIYPSLYGVGWTAPNLSRWVALALGPSPVAH